MLHPQPPKAAIQIMLHLIFQCFSLENLNLGPNNVVPPRTGKRPSINCAPTTLLGGGLLLLLTPFSKGQLCHFYFIFIFLFFQVFSVFFFLFFCFSFFFLLLQLPPVSLKKYFLFIFFIANSEFGIWSFFFD